MNKQEQKELVGAIVTKGRCSMIEYTGKRYRFLGFVVDVLRKGIEISRPKYFDEYMVLVIGWVNGPIVFFYKAGGRTHI